MIYSTMFAGIKKFWFNLMALNNLENSSVLFHKKRLYLLKPKNKSSLNR